MSDLVSSINKLTKFHGAQGIRNDSAKLRYGFKGIPPTQNDYGISDAVFLNFLFVVWDLGVFRHVFSLVWWTDLGICLVDVFSSA